MPEKAVLRDQGPWVIARWEKKQAERLARAERRTIERFERLLGIERRCEICNAANKQTPWIGAGVRVNGENNADDRLGSDDVVPAPVKASHRPTRYTTREIVA